MSVDSEGLFLCSESRKAFENLEGFRTLVVAVALVMVEAAAVAAVEAADKFYRAKLLESSNEFPELASSFWDAWGN